MIKINGSLSQSCWKDIEGEFIFIVIFRSVFPYMKNYHKNDIYIIKNRQK